MLLGRIAQGDNPAEERQLDARAIIASIVATRVIDVPCRCSSQREVYGSVVIVSSEERRPACLGILLVMASRAVIGPDYVSAFLKIVGMVNVNSPRRWASTRPLAASGISSVSGSPIHFVMVNEL